MSEQKHTIGPWVANCDIYPVMVYRESEEMEFVANTGESKANARLIAAAPDLLTALEYAIWAHPELEKSKTVMDAIAKATGASA